jgi:predicted GIY-YIG superfamily endonuclease
MTVNLSTPCFVYRCYVDDECVYVGASADPVARIEQHKAKSQWAWNITRFDSDRYDTGREALEVESAEIRRLRPRWNLTERGPRSTWQLSDYVEVVLATCANRPVAPYPYTAERIDKRIALMLREIQWRWPDIAPVVLGDLEPYTRSESAA